MRKFELVFNKVARFRSDMRNSANSRAVKDIIGDSTTNNRTVTVNQVIRYLETTRQRKTAKQVAAVYNVLRPFIVQARLRTDAIDLSELVDMYRFSVMDTKLYRKEVSTALRGL